MRTGKVVLVVAVVVTSALALGSFGGVVAATSGGDEPDENTHASDGDVVDVGRQNVEIRDLQVTISDTHVKGSGLPEESVDDATYTIDESVIETDGFLVTYQDTTYRICSITITIDDVGLRLDDVSIGENEGQADASGDNARLSRS